MNIIIWCDQLECIYNAASRVHHDHATDICEHAHPAIQKYSAGLSKITTCNSKTLKNEKQDKNKN